MVLSGIRFKPGSQGQKLRSVYGPSCISSISISVERTIATIAADGYRAQSSSVMESSVNGSHRVEVPFGSFTGPVPMDEGALESVGIVVLCGDGGAEAHIS